MDWKVFRPIAKELVRAGIGAYDNASRVLHDVIENVNALVAEARAELDNARPAGSPTVEGLKNIDLEGIKRSITDGLQHELGSNRDVLRALVHSLRQEDRSVPWLIERLRTRGLTDHVQSWVSNGPNRPLSSADVVRVLDEAHVTHLAQQAHQSGVVTTEVLAQLIPALIDRLTPLGELVTEDLFADGLAFLAEALL